MPHRQTPIRRRLRLMAVVAAAALLLAACGNDDDDAAVAPDETPETRPTVVATTSILGDVVTAIAGDQVEVVTIMPPNVDPHDFQASAQEVDQIQRADAVIANGAGFEEGLLDIVAAAAEDGVPVHEAASVLDLDDDEDHGRDDVDEDHGHGHDDDEGPADDDEGEDHGHSHDDDEGPADDDEGEDHGHDHGADDHDHDHEAGAHFFTDPVLMAEAVEGITEFLAETIDGIDVDALESSSDDYIDELEALDAEVEEILASVPSERRVLVTSHDVLGEFADRYGFEVLGSVIPTGSTADGASASNVAALAGALRDRGIPAVFSDASGSTGLVQTLAREVDGVEVVELYTEALGEAGSGADTYLGMVRTNAQRIADALG